MGGYLLYNAVPIINVTEGEPSKEDMNYISRGMSEGCGLFKAECRNFVRMVTEGTNKTDNVRIT